MSALQLQHRHSKREEQLLASLNEVLEANDYRWDGQVSLKDGPTLPSTTHSLKEHLVSKFVEMEATTNTNITALFTMTAGPDEIIESFEKLVKFCVECPSVSRTEVAQIVYPVFVHVYIYLFLQEYEEHAKVLSDRFSTSFDSSHQSEVSELLAFPSAKELMSSELANKYREKKYCMRMSDKAFHLLVQFLQVLHTPFLLTLIQRYLAIEVYGNAPMVAENSKPEPRKALTFTKPRLAQLDENRLHVKMKGSRHSSFGFILASSSDSSLSAKVTPGAQLAKISEFKKALTAAESIDPTSPSVAVYHVHSTDNSVHCAALSSASKQYACGFADSSIHVWSQLPGGAYNDSTTSHMTRVQPIGLPNSDHQLLVGHSGPVYSTCFSANGEFLLSGSEDSTVQLWDLDKCASVVSYLGHTYPVWDVTFSPIGVHFASASMDHTARLWTTDLTYPLRVFAGHTSSVNVVQFHPNGQYLATGSHDRTCRLWDIQSGQCVRLMAGNKSSVTSIACSPNGKQLASGGADGVTRVWDLGNGALVMEYPTPSQSTSRGEVSALAFSSDSALLASSSHLNCINVYNNLQGSSEDPLDLLSLSVSPKACSILQLQFSHRNCLVGVAKLESSSSAYTQQDLDS